MAILAVRGFREMDERRQELERIQAEIEQTLAGGSRLDPAEWLDKHPGLRPELDALLSTMSGRTASPGPPADETIDATAQGAPSHQADVTGDFSPGARGGSVPSSPGTRDRYIGDYELMSVLGRGGMGIVYRARQLSLNRQVALKMIHNAEFAGEEQLRRFQNEAEAVATLDHPGVVPIYEVGTHEDQHYFSMKLVEGRGMDKALGDLKRDHREAARVVAEVADAVHHAHQRGILHRDLKPANILLDREGHAHVTDFGLARRIEAGPGLTVTGALLGTPAYMSPEQAEGRNSAITTATDVYGVGAILFASLADRAPFVGDSVLLTLDRVRNNPPEPLRRLNPDVPVDLEVICSKCLEKDPRRRYGSAQELADDLRRWLGGEPILARPVGPSVRVALWARRKPALAALSAALVAASILGLIGIAWQWRAAVEQRDRAELARIEAIRQQNVALAAEAKAAAARDAAQSSEKVAAAARDAAQSSEKVAAAARAEAEKNAQTASMQATLALGTIQDLITRVSTGLDRPGLFDLKEEIIQAALRRVDGVANIYERSTNKEATTLAALMELGRIYRRTGRVDRANAIFQKCLGIARERIIIRNRNASSRINLALVLRELAYCAEQLDRDMNAVVTYVEEARMLYEDVLANPGQGDSGFNPIAARKELAETCNEQAIAQHRLGRINAALELFRRSFNLRVELVAETKDDPNQIRAAALASQAMADCSYRLGRREAAEALFREALELVERAAKADPESRMSKLYFAKYHTTVGIYRFRIGELETARRHFEAARELFDRLAKADEKDVVLQRELEMATSRLGQLADAEKKPELARREFEEASRLAEQIFRLDEKSDLRRVELMLVLPRIGQVDRAVEYADRLAAGPKVDPELWTFLAQTYAQAARALPPEQAERAQVLLTKGVDAVRKAIAKGFRDRGVLDLERGLDPLRGRDDFRALLRDLPPPD